MGNRSIVRRWGIKIEDYWRVFFSFYKKIRMQKRNRKLLESTSVSRCEVGADNEPARLASVQLVNEKSRNVRSAPSSLRASHINFSQVTTSNK